LIALLRKRQLDPLSIGTLIFFAAMSAIALASPHSSVHKWIPALSPGALALISGLSLVAGRPFTLEIAKRTTPESAWSLPQFIQINTFLTRVWTASFTGSAIVCAIFIGEIKSHSVLVLIAQIAGFVIPFHVTQKTVAAAKARAAAAGIAV
jgi:hypothetical protein